jgi:hypothetical protein
LPLDAATGFKFPSFVPPFEEVPSTFVPYQVACPRGVAQQCNNTTIQQYNNTTIHQYNNTTIQQYNNRS